MSTWISKALLAGAAIAALSGCVASGPDAGRSGPLFGGALTGSDPARSTPVMNGAVTIAGPEGYCVDTASSRMRGTAPFVLLAPCERLRSGVAGLIFRPRALMTATVTEGPGPSADGYRRFFSEPEGRAALSARGDATGLVVDQMNVTADGSFRVAVTEQTAEKTRNGFVDGRSWRAFFTVNDHLIAVSLRSPSDAPLTGERAKGLLDGLVSAIRAASAQAPQLADQG